MPNQWNSLGEGLIKGLGSLGMGFVEKGIKNDAQKLYEGIGGTYDKINKLRDKAIDVVQNNGAINLPEYQKDGVITGDTMPVRQQTQEDPNELIGNLYKDIIKKTGELNRNPYGKDYSNLIDKFYGSPKKKWNYDANNGVAWSIDDNGNFSSQQVTEGKSDERVLTSEENFIKEENPDGTFSYFKVYPIEKKTRGKVEIDTKKVPVTEKEYNWWVGSKMLPYEDKKNIDMNYNINLKSGLNDLGLLFKNSGQKSNGSSTEKLSELDKMSQSKLMSWNKNIYTVDSVYGGDISKAPKTIQDAIKEDYEYLKAQNVSDEDFKFYKKAFQNEDKISKQDIKKINDKRLKSYELELGGKSYDVLNSSAREQLISAIKNAMAQNQLSSDDILAKFNAIRDQLPPQVYQLIIKYFGK